MVMLRKGGAFIVIGLHAYPHVARRILDAGGWWHRFVAPGRIVP